jgi:hypothetical protein
MLSINPLFAVLDLVFLFSVFLYPLGLMIGGSCCCGDDTPGDTCDYDRLYCARITSPAPGGGSSVDELSQYDITFPVLKSEVDACVTSECDDWTIEARFKVTVGDYESSNASEYDWEDFFYHARLTPSMDASTIDNSVAGLIPKEVTDFDPPYIDLKIYGQGSASAPANPSQTGYPPANYFDSSTNTWHIYRYGRTSSYFGNNFLIFKQIFSPATPTTVTVGSHVLTFDIEEIAGDYRIRPNVFQTSEFSCSGPASNKVSIERLMALSGDHGRRFTFFTSMNPHWASISGDTFGVGDSATTTIRGSYWTAYSRIATFSMAESNSLCGVPAQYLPPALLPDEFSAPIGPTTNTNFSSIPHPCIDQVPQSLSLKRENLYANILWDFNEFFKNVLNNYNLYTFNHGASTSPGGFFAGIDAIPWIEDQKYQSYDGWGVGSGSLALGAGGDDGDDFKTPLKYYDNPFGNRIRIRGWKGVYPPKKVEVTTSATASIEDRNEVDHIIPTHTPATTEPTPCNFGGRDLNCSADLGCWKFKPPYYGTSPDPYLGAYENRQAGFSAGTPLVEDLVNDFNALPTSSQRTEEFTLYAQVQPRPWGAEKWVFPTADSTDIYTGYVDEINGKKIVSAWQYSRTTNPDDYNPTYGVTGDTLFLYIMCDGSMETSISVRFDGVWVPIDDWKRRVFGGWFDGFTTNSSYNYFNFSVPDEDGCYEDTNLPTLPSVDEPEVPGQWYFYQPAATSFNFGYLNVTSAPAVPVAEVCYSAVSSYHHWENGLTITQGLVFEDARRYILTDDCSKALQERYYQTSDYNYSIYSGSLASFGNYFVKFEYTASATPLATDGSEFSDCVTTFTWPGLTSVGPGPFDADEVWGEGYDPYSGITSAPDKLAFQVETSPSDACETRIITAAGNAYNLYTTNLYHFGNAFYNDYNWPLQLISFQDSRQNYHALRRLSRYDGSADYLTANQDFHSMGGFQSPEASNVAFQVVDAISHAEVGLAEVLCESSAEVTKQKSLSFNVVGIAAPGETVQIGYISHSTTGVIYGTSGNVIEDTGLSGFRNFTDASRYALRWRYLGRGLHISRNFQVALKGGSSAVTISGTVTADASTGRFEYLVEDSQPQGDFSIVVGINDDHTGVPRLWDVTQDRSAADFDDMTVIWKLAGIASVTKSIPAPTVDSITGTGPISSRAVPGGYVFASSYSLAVSGTTIRESSVQNYVILYDSTTGEELNRLSGSWESDFATGEQDYAINLYTNTLEEERVYCLSVMAADEIENQSTGVSVTCIRIDDEEPSVAFTVNGEKPLANCPSKVLLNAIDKQSPVKAEGVTKPKTTVTFAGAGGNPVVSGGTVTLQEQSGVGSYSVPLPNVDTVPANGSSVWITPQFETFAGKVVSVDPFYVSHAVPSLLNSQIIDKPANYVLEFTLKDVQASATVMAYLSQNGIVVDEGELSVSPGEGTLNCTNVAFGAFPLACKRFVHYLTGTFTSEITVDGDASVIPVGSLVKVDGLATGAVVDSASGSTVTFNIPISVTPGVRIIFEPPQQNSFAMAVSSVVINAIKTSAVNSDGCKILQGMELLINGQTVTVSSVDASSGMIRLSGLPSGGLVASNAQSVIAYGNHSYSVEFVVTLPNGNEAFRQTYAV